VGLPGETVGAGLVGGKGVLPIYGFGGREEARRVHDYYLLESARVDGEPRIVSQEYLGRQRSWPR
jgi:hypothetical protein